MLNIVVLTGRLTADPELNTTASGVAYTRCSVAVQRRYKAGEDPIVDFINIVAWRHTAEFICKYFKKGKMIAVEGCIQTGKYEDSEGRTRYTFDVLANNVQFVEGQKRDENDSSNQDAPVAAPKPAQSGAFMDVSADDDLPF